MGFVLIVDDHVDTCHVMAMLVRRFGREARCVHSGAEALAAAGSAAPDLVLLDISMPGMDGLETLERLRAMPACGGVPVVMFTAIDDAATRRRAAALGANDYVLKASFDLRGFQAVLTSHLSPAADQRGDRKDPPA